MPLLDQLTTDYPGITFEESDHSRWDPENKIVYFDPEKTHSDWSLLHETGHMISKHTNYDTDIELLQMEVEAWDKATELAKKYKIKIDKDHVEDCLDSYRDWLYKRSLCPKCDHTGLEVSTGNYSCINCRAEWQVSKERFCRVYRKTKTPA